GYRRRGKMLQDEAVDPRQMQLDPTRSDVDVGKAGGDRALRPFMIRGRRSRCQKSDGRRAIGMASQSRAYSAIVRTGVAPNADRHASVLDEDSPHLPERVHAVRKELQS